MKIASSLLIREAKRDDAETLADLEFATGEMVCTDDLIEAARVCRQISELETNAGRTAVDGS